MDDARAALGRVADTLGQASSQVATRFGVDRHSGFEVLNASTEFDVALLNEICDGSAREVVGFVDHGGVRPMGFGPACSGSVSDLASRVRGGRGSNSNFISCVTGAAAEIQSECGPDANEPQVEIPEDEITVDDGEESDTTVETPEDEITVEPNTEVEVDEDEIVVEPATPAEPTPPNYDAEQDIANTWAMVGTVLGAIGVIVEAPIIIAAGAVVAVVGGVTWLILQAAEAFGIGGDDSCLGFAMAEGGSISYENPNGGWVDIGDLALRCMCHASPRGGAALGPESACGNGGLGQRVDCLANPLGPDDRIRTECLLMLEEDYSPWTPPDDSSAAICGVLDCPSGVSVSLDSQCRCEQVANPGSSGVVNVCEAVLCPPGSVAVPNAGGCGCESLLRVTPPFTPRR